MAITTLTIKNSIGVSTTSDAFNTVYNAGAGIPHSGIYRCNICGREIAMNKHENTLPPHYPNDTCSSPKWQLHIFAQN